MNKKAFIQEKLYWMIIGFVLAGIFITGSFVFISKISSSSLYERLYLSRALAVRTSTVLTAPGELQNFYTHKELQNFNIKLDPKIITVIKKDESTSSANYFFPENKHIQTKSRVLFTPPTLGFEKQDNYITITPKTEIILIKNRCPIEASTAQGLILDPAHGEWDKGIVQGDFIESEINRQIAYQIFRNSPYEKTSSTRSATKDIARAMDKRIGDISQKKNYALVSIHTNPNNNEIKTYINANTNILQSRKLACIINNALTEILPDAKPPAIIPINPSHIEEDSQLQILKPAEIGVLIEISHPAVRPEIIGETIKKALTEYKASLPQN